MYQVVFQIVAHDGDCLIAFEMNGKPLPLDNGYPARAIIPGHAGARQPKWIRKLEVASSQFPAQRDTRTYLNV